MGRSNLTVVANAGKNPTPWKEPEGAVGYARGGVIPTQVYATGKHPAGSGLRIPDSTSTLLQKLHETRNDTHRRRLRAMHAQCIAALESELQGIVVQHETETLLLDYRLAGNTLEGLGDLAEDAVIAEAWGKLSEEFEL